MAIRKISPIYSVRAEGYFFGTRELGTIWWNDAKHTKAVIRQQFLEYTLGFCTLIIVR